MTDLQNVLSCDNPEDYLYTSGWSCSGLQHYVALKRDMGGAKQVNLMQSDRPGDIYTHVANMVQDRVNHDAQNPASKHRLGYWWCSRIGVRVRLM